MKKPQMLRAGDTVALVSLSAGIAGDAPFSCRTAIAVRRLEEQFGLRVQLMPGAMKGAAFLDENPRARADDLMAAFADPQVRAVIAMIGGDDTIRLLPHIDFGVLADNPKIFMGYSDTTINHFMLHKAGLVSFYGPSVLAEFAENVAMHDYTVRYIRQVLFEVHDILPIDPSPQWTSEFLEWSEPANNHIRRAMRPDEHGYQLLQGEGVARGPLLGGCIDVFPMLMGTCIWPGSEEWEGRILFIETSEEQPSPSTVLYLLRGMAAQGIFDAVNGVVVGKPKDERYFEEYKEVLLRAIGREAGRPDLPVLYNLNFGHNAPMCILPYGVMAEIDCAGPSFRLVESAVLPR